jgi:hypothetical protein
MPCDRAIKLRADYDAALMLWGKTLFLSQRKLDPEERRKVNQSRRDALTARDDSARRLASHQQVCAVCRRENMKLV